MRRSVGFWLLASWVAAGCAPDEQAQSAAPEPAPAPAEPASAQAVAGPGWTGLTDPLEIIEARRVLMTEAERLMKPIDSYTVGEAADADELRSAATTLEALLLAAPHLFPPTTNLFDPAELDPPTTALPTIWDRFAAFQTFAGAAERAAAALATAEDGEPLRAASARLRAACDTCHAQFMKPYTPPVVTDEDREFDFDSVFEN